MRLKPLAAGQRTAINPEGRTPISSKPRPPQRNHHLDSYPSAELRLNPSNWLRSISLPNWLRFTYPQLASFLHDPPTGFVPPVPPPVFAGGVFVPRHPKLASFLQVQTDGRRLPGQCGEIRSAAGVKISPVGVGYAGVCPAPTLFLVGARHRAAFFQCAQPEPSAATLLFIEVAADKGIVTIHRLPLVAGTVLGISSPQLVGAGNRRPHA